MTPLEQYLAILSGQQDPVAHDNPGMAGMMGQAPPQGLAFWPDAHLDAGQVQDMRPGAWRPPAGPTTGTTMLPHPPASVPAPQPTPIHPALAQILSAYANNNVRRM